ncbi:MAG TPA: Ig-like domain-containing protein [Candidatus Deferrimicrobium sp.]|nr:Ig-like domain-containing protein [Candidatus Deferrimicrobium sp.]
MKRRCEAAGALALILGWVSCSGDIVVTLSPDVVWTYPESGATNVSATDTIVVGFSKDMDPSSLTTETFQMRPGVPGKVTSSGMVATFVPSGSLAFGSLYTVTITTAARDTEGRKLKLPYSWSFTTKPPPPSISGFSPRQGRASTVVTINGFNFSDRTSGNGVKFNGVTAQVITATPTEVKARVPFGAKTGSVTLSTAGGRATAAGEFDVLQPGVIWETVSSGTVNSLEAIAMTANLYIAVGNLGTIITSDDGFVWQTRQDTTVARLFDLASSGYRIVAVGSGPTIVLSVDGVVWRTLITDLDQALFGVTWTGSEFIAVGANGYIVRSFDGRGWQEIFSPTDQWLYDVTKFNFKLFACGHSGTIITSSNGDFWTREESGTNETLLDMLVFQDTLLAVGYSGIILASADGSTWTQRASGTAVHLGAVTRGQTPDGPRVIAVGQNGTVLDSPDGLTWVERETPVSADLNDVIWDGRQFIAVGADGVILVSY